MAASLTRGKRIGDVVKWETDGGSKGFCRKTTTIRVESDIDVGAVLDSSGNWVDGSSSSGSSAKYILIDEKIADYSSGDTPSLTVLYQGPAIVAKNALSFDGSGVAADYTAVTTALASLNIVVEDSVA